jgi:hypothetical protein
MSGPSTEYAGTFMTFTSSLVNIVDRNVEGTESVFFRAVTNTATNIDTNTFEASVACASSSYVLVEPTPTTDHPLPS